VGADPHDREAGAPRAAAPTHVAAAEEAEAAQVDLDAFAD